MTTYTAVGTTDENTECDCCGKTNLKMTVVLRDDEGNFAFFGRSCAARATGWRTAHLDRKVIEANNERDHHAGIAARFAEYLSEGEAGVTRFIANNRVACERFYPTREAVCRNDPQHNQRGKRKGSDARKDNAMSPYTQTSAGYPITVNHGPRCGLCGHHHENVAAIKACYAITKEEQEQADCDYRAELAVERHFEDRGYWEARAQDDYEARNGVVGFIEAWHLASPETCPCEDHQVS